MRRDQQVHLDALFEHPPLAGAHTEIQHRIGRDRLVLDQAVAYLQQLPDRQRKCRVAEHRHQHRKTDGVRIQDRQALARRQAGEPEEILEFPRRGAMAGPVRLDVRQLAVGGKAGRRAPDIRHEAKDGRLGAVFQADSRGHGGRG
ncbi:MAG: hypothetical protein Q8M11_06780 [Sulfuritalea sp.]|nr:hypothetical protein [Sulfuritalea sp.]MDP1982877.1 hypothetical protein [Sulfuritalea sp.]